MRSDRNPPGHAIRARTEITGVVQGVGFRPTIARLAAHHGVAGFVYNDAGAVHCEFEGAPQAVAAMIADVEAHAPPAARIDAIT